MGPADFLLIVQFISAAVKAAPQIEEIVIGAKNLITSMFKAGVITAEQQQQVHDHVDAICAAALAGTTPPSWQVEADPT